MGTATKGWSIDSQENEAKNSRERGGFSSLVSVLSGPNSPLIRLTHRFEIEPDLIGPTLWLQKTQHVPPRNRIHVDGASAFTSLIDTEGNVVDIATWQGRD